MAGFTNRDGTASSSTIGNSYLFKFLYCLVNIDDYIGKVIIGVQAFSVCETSFFPDIDT
jgi:hypothetical protein